MALRDVLTHAVEVEKESRKHAGPPGGSGTGRMVLLMLSVPALAFSVYSFVARPEFIWGANPANVSAVRQDANLRFTMFLLSQRIRSQFKARGRLPASWAEVGETPKGITYTVVSDSVFELRADERNQVLVLRSNEPPKQFLGDAPSVIAGRSQ